MQNRVARTDPPQSSRLFSGCPPAASSIPAVRAHSGGDAPGGAWGAAGVGLGLGIHPTRRGLAEELGARDRHGRAGSLDLRDVGLDVTGYDPEGFWIPEEKEKREPLPPGHRFFRECLKETEARFIEWSMSVAQVDSWFITLTFKSYIPELRAHRLLKGWLGALWDAYRRTTGLDGLRWIVAQEWQKRLVIHFHLLLSGVRLNELSRMRWEHRWMGMGEKVAARVELFPCGFARIYPARKRAAPYLAKYAGKTGDQNGLLIRGGSWQGLTVRRSLSCCKA